MSATQTIATSSGEPARATVRVFHNNHTPDSYLVGFKPGHTVTEVFTYPTFLRGESDDHIVADEAFELLNIGDDPDFGTPDPRARDYHARGNRSLSVGDVVAIDGRFHACAPFGWRELSEAPLIKQITSRGTTPLTP